MYVWLNLKTVKFYLTKLATDIYWQPIYKLEEIAPLDSPQTANSHVKAVEAAQTAQAGSGVVLSKTLSKGQSSAEQNLKKKKNRKLETFVTFCC